MPVRQITIRLPSPLKLAFERYAIGLGLGSSELAKLLIVRENRQRRLKRLEHSAIEALRRKWRPVEVEMATITAHVASLRKVRAFDAYARSCGLSRSKAGAWILCAELEEHWLERSITSDQ